MNLPSELSNKWGSLPGLTFRGNGEWSAACPVCGGAELSRRDKPDRFRMFAASGGHDARGWCRRCGYFEWATGETIAPDPVAIAEAQELQRRLRLQEEARLQAKIQELQQAAYWQGYHDAMTAQHRALWQAQGIDDGLQDWFRLGYRESYRYQHNGEYYESPAMTIPIFDFGWQAVNVQYRLIRPAEGAGKYRFTAGLPAPLFLTEPDADLTGAVLLVEGAKKAIVAWSHLVARANAKMRVVAVPSKTPGKELIARLADCEPVYIALDPDAYTYGKSADGRIIKPSVNRVVGMLRGRARVVKLPVKPDDFFTEYAGTSNDFQQYLQQAVRA